MNFISIDIETTSLDPNMGQILQIGAVAVISDDFGRSVTDFPYFNAPIHHERLYGDVEAIRINAKLIEKIAKAPKGQFFGPMDTAETFARWLDLFRPFFKSGKIVAAGKNFAGFDLQWLRRFGNENLQDIAGKFHHRCIDPAMLYVEPCDDVPPSLHTCMQRYTGDVNIAPPTHDALADARAVAELIRYAQVRAEVQAA